MDQSHLSDDEIGGISSGMTSTNRGPDSSTSAARTEARAAPRRGFLKQAVAAAGAAAAAVGSAAQAAGKPMGVFLHGTVGLQHAAMAIYNAWVDRVPAMVIAGNGADANKRRPGTEWNHSVQDAAAMVPDYVKWDDAPASLQHFAQSTVRAYRIATTPPMEPVLVMADIDLQEDAIHDSKLHIPKLSRSIPPQGDSAALAEAAKWLVEAKFPVIVADRMARNQQGVDALVKLAEALGAAVVDMGGRMNFPNQHPLCHSDRRGALVREADVVLLLEVADPWGQFNSFSDPQKLQRYVVAKGVKIVNLSMQDVYIRSNYQDFQRYMPAAVGAALVGNEIDNPAIDYAKLAQAHGMWAEGPISDPRLPKAALQRALAVVKSGRPALLDVVCPPR